MVLVGETHREIHYLKDKHVKAAAQGVLEDVLAVLGAVKDRGREDACREARR